VVVKSSEKSLLFLLYHQLKSPLSAKADVFLVLTANNPIKPAILFLFSFFLAILFA